MSCCKCSNLIWRALACGAVLLFALTCLQGCCDDPEPQLDWTPDYENFKERAAWVDEKGVWRGNPTWSFSPELEVEDHHCKTWNGTICVVWTVHEWNCIEHDFGVCKCTELATNGDYCSAWGCHALEADQEVCKLTEGDKDGSAKEHCEYSHFPMDEGKYIDLLQRQNAGSLTTGEQWWSYGWHYHWRRLSEKKETPDVQEDDTFHSATNQSEISNPSVNVDERRRKLFSDEGRRAWPPIAAYSVEGRHNWISYSDVCIVNGDNSALARWKCSRWREIETEISYCTCKYGERQACLSWTCEERDVGLFSVLWRTSEDIKPYSEGSEMEEYQCLSLDVDGRCLAYEGHIQSREEVEWTRCERNGNSWLCDEYEYPKTLIWHHPEYSNKWLIFLLIEVVFCCFFLGTCDDENNALFAVLLCDSCVGLILLPFLIVTFGTYAFLAIGLPFWILRCLCCARLVITPMLRGGDRPLRGNSRDRLKAGVGFMIGRGQSNSNVV